MITLAILAPLLALAIIGLFGWYEHSLITADQAKEAAQLTAAEKQTTVVVERPKSDTAALADLSDDLTVKREKAALKAMRAKSRMRIWKAGGPVVSRKLHAKKRGIDQRVGLQTNEKPRGRQIG